MKRAARDLSLFLARRRSLRSAQWRWIAALGLPCTLMALYALSYRVTFAGQTLVQLGFLSDILDPVTRTLRSSGRFIWTIHYLAIAIVVAGLVRLAPPGVAVAALTIGLGPEVYDLAPVRRKENLRLHWTYLSELKASV